MSPSPPSPADPSAAALDEAAQAREMEAFWRQQDPVDLAAVDWHTRRENGLSPAGQAELQHWLAASPAHAEAFAQLEQGLCAVRAIPAAGAWQTDGRPLPAAQPPRAGRRQGSPARRWRPWNGMGPRQGLVAFCGAVLLALAVGWHQWMQQPSFSQHFAVERGQRQTVTLPDGSEMAIDADTRVQVTLYRDHREVRLASGAVMFAVAPDRDKPFQVLAGPARVTVVGTRFSVRYRSTGMDAGAVKVAVEQGQVRVAGLGGPPADGRASGETSLTAGQGLSMAADGAAGPVTTVAPGTIGLWRKGLVRFEDMRLGDALLELERYGPTGLSLRDPAVAAMPLGGSFRIDRPAEFARMLPQILPVQLVRRSDGRTEIVKAP